MTLHVIFVAVVAATCGILSLGAALYFARSVLRHVYPELRARPHVLQHPVQAFWRPQCLTPAGREAHARCLAFASIAATTLAVALFLSLKTDILAALS
jgi:hypothetical protein